MKGGIIYQIFPDRFYCSGTEKKAVPQGRVMRKWGEEPYWNQEQFGSVWNNDYFGGDLKGIEQKLPYIKSLGVSCIYLNPVLPPIQIIDMILRIMKNRFAARHGAGF